MRLRRNTFAAATWSEESEIVRCFAAAAGAVTVAADGLSRPREGRITRGSRTHTAANRLHTSSLAVAGGLA
jgi:hypothetical protein